MLIKRLTLIFLCVGMPSALLAEFNEARLPSAAKWYFHADFEEMRTSEAGKHLYAWLQDEAFADIQEDIGIDLDKEADQITAFAAGAKALTVVVDGAISQETRDKVIAIGAATGGMDKMESAGRTYYYVKGEEETESRDDDDFNLDSLEDGAYFSFAIDNKAIVTSTEAEMTALLANEGRIADSDSKGGPLVVLSADRSLMLAGLNTSEIDDELGWDSNIVRNTRQVALLLADEAGKLAIEAQLVTEKKEMAESLASIVRGLISLQIFNDELDPEISGVLQNTTVGVEGTRLQVKIALDPELVIANLE